MKSIVYIFFLAFISMGYAQDSIIYHSDKYFERYILYPQNNSFKHIHQIDALNIETGAGNYQIKKQQIYFFFHESPPKDIRINKTIKQDTSRFIKLAFYDGEEKADNMIYPRVQANIPITTGDWNGFLIDKKSLKDEWIIISYYLPEGNRKTLKIKNEPNLYEIKICLIDPYDTIKYEENFVRVCRYKQTEIICNRYYRDSPDWKKIRLKLKK